MQEQLSNETILATLDKIYDASLNGIPNVSASVVELAEEYMAKYDTVEEACKEMIKNQVLKCTTSGFVTGFGGFLVLPIMLPANITSVLYMQMRMIAAVAYMSGLDLNSDEVQTFVYACLAGIGLNSFVKTFGIQFSTKCAVTLIKRIPGKLLTTVNRKVGFRFLTKFGSKGLINLAKLVPVVGAGVSALFDYTETQIIADRAYEWFINGNMSGDMELSIEEINGEMIITEDEK